MKTKILRLVICLLPLINFAQKKVTSKDLDELVKLMTGSFSSELQAKKDTDYFDIRLHMKRIWPERTGEYWLYVEQAMAGKPDKPYRQRVYNLRLHDDTTIASVVYEFKHDALRYAGEWRNEKPLDNLPLDSFRAREGCIIYLHKTGKKKYDGATHASDCSSNLRGASYATSEAHIRKKGMNTWDRGFDKDGKHVWGAAKGGYDFRKLEQY